ncbi:MAG TPA: hypothetical protein VJN18_13720 [Polyangiaceae bacterium]|nr:hypothetical protein [Polyangiaceae bacterium]
MLKSKLTTVLIAMSVVACGGRVERDETDVIAEPGSDVAEPGSDVAESGSDVEHLDLGVLQVLVPVEGVSLKTLSYRVNAVRDGHLIQEGEVKVTTTTYEHPSGSRRTDLAFAISLPPSKHNLLNWNGQWGEETCEGALGPFDIEAMRTATFISPSSCDR